MVAEVGTDRVSACVYYYNLADMTPAGVYRWSAQDGPLKGLYRISLYKIQPNQFHTVLLYNRGTEPHTILGGHPGRPGGLSAA